MGKRFSLIRCFVIAVATVLIAPIMAGILGFAVNHGGVTEQLWLDRAVNHLVELRQGCKDPELQDVLDYTIERYDRIGPFGVAVGRCNWYMMPTRGHVLGLNNPLCPGITLDIDLLTDYSLHQGAMILVHEALHDYPPYFGHSHVSPVMDKLEAHYMQRRMGWAYYPTPTPKTPVIP